MINKPSFFVFANFSSITSSLSLGVPVPLTLTNYLPSNFSFVNLVFIFRYRPGGVGLRKKTKDPRASEREGLVVYYESMKCVQSES